MARFKTSTRSGALALSIVLSLAGAALAPELESSRQPGPELGRAATPEEVAPYQLVVLPDGTGLPPGRGTAVGGFRVYAAKCLMCHGPGGKDGPLPPLVGGQGSLASAAPLRTVGSYWPYATTLFDYTRRAMPYDLPGSLSADELYAVTAYLLAENGILADDAELNAETLPQVDMPNRNGFFTSPTTPTVERGE